MSCRDQPGYVEAPPRGSVVPLPPRQTLTEIRRAGPVALPGGRLAIYGPLGLWAYYTEDEIQGAVKALGIYAVTLADATHNDRYEYTAAQVAACIERQRRPPADD